MISSYRTRLLTSVWFAVVIIINITYRQTSLTVAYNLDTKHAVLFDYPFRLDESRSNSPNFGHSVLMNNKKQNGHDRISFLIGAPNANSSGSIFNCIWRPPANRANCHPVQIHFGSYGPTDGMHLGSNLIQRTSIPDQYLTCAFSRTYNFTSNYNPGEYFLNPTGACYVMQLDQTRPIVELAPLNDKGKQFHPSNMYEYSHSMFGFAPTFTSDGTRLLSGIPGFQNWNGAMVSISVLDSQYEMNFHQVKTGRDHYMGYSITVGNFFTNKIELAVLGVPRLNLIGSVVFCIISPGGKCRSFSEIKGNQVGEYFGSSVLAIDLNGDGLDDLLVGSPMYSTLRKGYSDEGRILVYQSTGTDFILQTILYGMQKTDARFGTSMANLGDVNNDGFNDVVISAPYEDDQKGAIYIYRGSPHGIQSNFSQRISAADPYLSSLNLYGFGFSFSANIDIDNNNFNDLMVGAYLSNKAVLLRTRPIISLPTKIEVNNKFVDLNQECLFLDSSDRDRFPYSPACVSLRYCFSTAQFPHSLEATLSTSLWIDQRHERAFVWIKDTNYRKQQFVRLLESKLVLRRQVDPICSDNFVVLLKEASKIQNLLDPIEFGLSYNFVNDGQNQGDIFHIPMIDNGKNNLTEQIHFQLCSKGTDECLSELIISPIVLVDNQEMENLSNIELVEGSYRNITLQLSVTNFADPAYGTKLNLTSNTKLSLITLDHKCHFVDYELSNGTNILCELDSPLKGSDSIELVFNSFLTIGKVKFDLNTTIINNLAPDGVNKKKIVFNTTKIASINLNSTDLWPRIQYQQNVRKNDVYFSNTLQLQRLGHSSIDLVELYFFYPSSHNGQFFVISPLKILNLDKSILMKCHPEQDFNFAGLYGVNFSSFQMISNYDQIKYLNLTCSNFNFICKMVKCEIGPMSINSISAFYKYSSSLNVTLVESKYRNYKYDEITYHVKMMAKVVDVKLNPVNVWNDVNFVFEPIYQIPVTPFLIWPFILGLILGLLLLILFIWLLKKCGFFKRNNSKKDENNQEETAPLN